MTILEQALKYARAGWPVMPLAGARVVDGKLMCSCYYRSACISPAKHPRTVNGLFDATTDPDIITDWFTQWPTANIGLRTGVKFDVLDIDGDEGYASFSDAIDGEIDGFHGPIAKTGKGLHLYVKPTGYTNRAHPKPGIDFRGAGGYVVAPPSLHVNGIRYEWTKKEPLADIPGWMDLLLNPPPDPTACKVQMRHGPCGRLDSHRHRGGVAYEPVSLDL